ncbi:4-alpha-glucanotransferase [soil metagenome]
MSGSALPEHRSSGILLHPTSLPGQGIGALGSEAIAFIELLAEAGQAAWQLLPLVAVNEGGSPYNGLSAFGANPLLVDLGLLVAEGLLKPEEIHHFEDDVAAHIDYSRVTEWKQQQLWRAYGNFADGAAPDLRAAFQSFCRHQSFWLDDYAIFRALRDRNEGAAWTEWKPSERDRNPGELERSATELGSRIQGHKFHQFIFQRQWQALREHARRRGIRIIGDIPIFVAHDSADVWANRELFELDEQGEPRVVSGVPPDYFSETGQRWGNPLYRWDVLRKTGYAWWMQRFRRTLDLVDVARIDHFRGFQAYWEVPADEETALNGRWVPGPGRAFFDRLRQEIGELPVIAEDLGLITAEVEELRDQLEFPGMRVLQFAFGDDSKNPHLPENHVENSVAYTGTHDNDTIVGWWKELSAKERTEVASRLPTSVSGDIHWQLMTLVARSKAKLVIFPAQDLLGLGSEARMNTPGTAADNWSWRLPDLNRIDRAIITRLRDLTRKTGRLEVGDAARETP